MGWAWGTTEAGGFTSTVLFATGIAGEGATGDGTACTGAGAGAGAGAAWGVDVAFNWGTALCCETGGFCVGFI